MIGVDEVPVAMSSEAMRAAVSIGMAKPRPMLPTWPPRLPPSEAMAELMPMTAPLPSTSGPPELPGLMAASVWIALMKASSPSPPAVTGRLSALTMPAVTVPWSPSGEPRAIAASPTSSALEEPSVTAGRPVSSTFTTARS